MSVFFETNINGGTSRKARLGLMCGIPARCFSYGEGRSSGKNYLPSSARDHGFTNHVGERHTHISEIGTSDKDVDWIPELINGCDYKDDLVLDEASRCTGCRTTEIDSARDSCSSSKSDIVLTSVKSEIDEMGECSSSSVTMEAGYGDISEKDLCISILRNHGVLECARAARIDTLTNHFDVSSDIYCHCKACSVSESSTNMLICDNCEEAFHVSCCHPPPSVLSIDEWFCNFCLKKNKLLKLTLIKATYASLEATKEKISFAPMESNPITCMLTDDVPYVTSVRIGKAFQVEVPEWLGPLGTFNVDVDKFGAPLNVEASNFSTSQVLKSIPHCNADFIGNWLQCRMISDVNGYGDRAICGKWRRAPLFEVQTDNWECFSCVSWDPFHADCAVPQELETEEVIKQLGYIQQLRPHLMPKQRKMEIETEDEEELMGEVIINKPGP